MKGPYEIKATSFFADVAVALAYVAFMYAHLVMFFLTLKVSFLIMIISETLVVLFFLYRNRERVLISKDPYDFLIALIGTFLGLLLRPTGNTETLLAVCILFIGFLIQIGGLLSLNRSFGIVPANRGVKNGGLFKFVRHPMYAGYIVIFIGYILTNHSSINVAIVLLAICFFILRIAAEERLLSNDEKYQEFKKHTVWKLIPFIY